MLVLLTLAVAWSKRSKKRDPLEPPPQTRSVEAAPSSSQRCAIAHARFGGRRARLVKIVRGGVPTYVVLDLGRHDPLARLQQGDWVRATYGAGEQTWLGEFGSAAAALVRASRLCPPSVRCWPGESGCGATTEPLTPVQAFLPAPALGPALDPALGSTEPPR